jgi:hypothetical protein
MVRAVSSCPTTAPGSGLLRSLVFTALAVAMGWVFLHVVSPEPEEEMAVLSVGSGEGYGAADIVRAAVLLHKEKGLRIDFVGPREKGSILVFREKDWHCLGCGCVVRIGVE